MLEATLSSSSCLTGQALKHAQNLEVPVFYFPLANASLNPRIGIALGTRLTLLATLVSVKPAARENYRLS